MLLTQFEWFNYYAIGFEGCNKVFIPKKLGRRGEITKNLLDEVTTKLIWEQLRLNPELLDSTKYSNYTFMESNPYFNKVVNKLYKDIKLIKLDTILCF